MLNFTRENKGNFASWARNVDKTIILMIFIFFLLGLFFSFSSTSSMLAEKLNTKSYHFFIKHLVFVIIGFSFIFYISLQNKELIKNYFPTFFFITLILLLLVPFFGSEVKGSKRWLEIFFLPRFQPIEIVKPFFVLIIAKVLSSETMSNSYKKYFNTIILLSLVLILLVIQPDLGQSILIFLTWLIMIFSSGINLLILTIFFMVALILVASLLLIFPNKFGYIILRLKTFIDPSQGNNYQSEKALESIINGGFFGKGIGEGVLKERVPEAHTDYIIAVISEEYGAILILGLIFLFLFLTFVILKKLLYEKDEFIKLTLIGLISLILIQAFIHVGVNIRMFPTTGMTLPFISYGGSSIVGTSLIAGIVINLTKRDTNTSNLM